MKHFSKQQHYVWKHQIIITNTMCGNIVTNKTAMCVN